MEDKERYERQKTFEHENKVVSQRRESLTLYRQPHQRLVIHCSISLEIILKNEQICLLLKRGILLFLLPWNLSFVFFKLWKLPVLGRLHTEFLHLFFLIVRVIAVLDVQPHRGGLQEDWPHVFLGHEYESKVKTWWWELSEYGAKWRPYAAIE